MASATHTEAADTVPSPAGVVSGQLRPPFFWFQPFLGVSKVVGREIIASLGAGKPVVGTAVFAAGNVRFADAFSQAGVDFVFIDNEHNPMDRESSAWAIRLFAARGVAPLIRIPSADPSLAAQAMDAGAHGVIVPYVESAEQVRHMVGALKYRPLKGKALDTVLTKGEFPSPETEEYLADWNPDSVLVVMIESPAGIAALDSILAVPGVDAVLVGPHDLSVSVGRPEAYDSPEWVEAMQQVVDTCRAKGIGVGAHLSRLDLASFWLERGCNFLCYSSDLSLALGSLRADLEALRPT